jgi:microcystin degradation protein MlrC
MIRTIRSFFAPTKGTSSKRLRVAIGRIAQETNALSPLLTELSDFHAMHFLEGDDLLAACLKGGSEVKGFMKNAELSGFVQRAQRFDNIEIIPTVSAWAIPSGPLSQACFESLTARLLQGLAEAGPLDAIFLSMHGAMGAEGVNDPEAEILARVRAQHPTLPIAVTLDLHANMTQERLATGALFFGYHTNPHRDHAARGARAAEVLIPAARGETKPVTRWRTLPMMMGGSPTLDVLPPMLGIYRRCKKLEQGEALGASVFMCHPWLDAKSVGWSTLVITDANEDRADKLAEELADRCWAVKDKLPGDFFKPADVAIQAARDARIRRKLGTIVLSDSSDVTTAGAPGDSTKLMHALAAQGHGMKSLIAVRDPEVARALLGREVGSEVAIEVGGKLDPARQTPFLAKGRVMRTRDDEGHGKRVRIDVPLRDKGMLHIVVTEGPTFNMKPGFYTEMGLSPHRADIVVVKNFFPFRIFYAPYARKTIYVRTGGTTDVDAAYVIPFDGPIHPREKVEDWRPTDARRRQ